MPKRDIIVIGGSAGSIEVIRAIVRSLHKDLSATVFIVIHMAARERSMLRSILASGSPFPVVRASEGQQIAPGKIYVAVPDHHLIIAKDHLHVSRGPREGLHRPSINATFRSAALTYGPRVIGVLVSGMLDDGASGLWEIARNGGVTIVQDPEEARFPSMPRSALEDSPVNYTLRVDTIGPILIQLVSGMEMPKEGKQPRSSESELAGASGFTCPECHGPLRESRAQPPEFRCRVGHIFSLRSLIDEQTSNQERKLYETIVAFEEGADILEFAVRAQIENGGSHDELLKEAAELRRQAEIMRGLLQERAATPLE